jgi:glycerol-3-phosphate O-acyltransferase/dihydroxyacetone phosphate acyltransferase
MMALGAMSEHITENIKIVPVGLNYFNRNKFRSEVIIEFGRAFEVPREWAEEFKVNKKDSTEKLLKEIEFRMKAVTLTAPSFLELRSIFFIRKLYIPVDAHLSPAQFSELCKRFNKGYEKLKDREEIKPEMKKVQNYMEEIDFLGLTDSQVKKMDFSYSWLLRQTIMSIMMFSLFLIISLPGILLFVPAGLFIRNKAEKERIAAKKKNPNKIEGLDVVSSVKVTYFVMCLPILFILWNIICVYLNKFFMYSNPYLGLIILIGLLF